MHLQTVFKKSITLSEVQQANKQQNLNIAPAGCDPLRLRLRDFLRLLRDGKVAAVKIGNTRYVHLRHDAPFVAEIKVVSV